MPVSKVLGLVRSSILLTLTATMALSAIGQDKSLPKTLLVAQDGSGDYRSIQAALQAAPASGAIIKIKPGTYYETLAIDTPHLELRGLGSNPSQVVISAGHSAGDSGGTGKSATVTVRANDFYADNLTIENTFTRTHALTQEGSQAVALRTLGDRQVYRNIRLLGYQDTLYADSATCHDLSQTGPCSAARQYFANCYIEGHVDFIFGDAKAVFENCELHSLAHPVSHITAQSKKYAAEDSGYVFNHCKLTAEAGADRVFLGRPWRAYATVIFLNTFMGKQIMPAGWDDWKHDDKSSLPTVFYAEFNSSGPGANPTARIRESHQLTAKETAKYATKQYLAGTDGWNPEEVR